jgi:hypothetical protein
MDPLSAAGWNMTGIDLLEPIRLAQMHDVDRR